MNFSIVLISKNEEKTLPRLLNSLKEFKERDGEIVLVDTGSTDKTAQVARDLGCKVTEVGDKFIKTINNSADINNHFIVKSEEPILKMGDKLFDYSGARNYAASLAKNDIVAMPDCDEEYTCLDLDKIQEVIKNGAEQLEYNFVFSHDQYGNEAIKFRHCKFYDRRKLKWRGIIHEILAGTANKIFLEENIIKLEHYQNHEQNRGGYLKGLALDCFENQDNDRNSHYLARELGWSNRPLSAIKEFTRHIAMNKWPAERGQSLIFIGDAYGQLGSEEKQIEFYQKAFNLDASRRESLMRLAQFYYKKKDAQRTACYAASALEIPWNGFYANQRQHYTQEPHELLYWALWKTDKEKSKFHWEKALEYQPLNTKYLEAAKWYLKLPKVSIIIPSLREKRLQELLKIIKQTANYPDYEIIVEKDDFKNIQGVPKLLKRGVERSTEELVMYLGDDCIPQQNFLILAVLKMKEVFGEDMDGLVGLNDMYWKGGEFYTHWLASKKLLPFLDGEFFYTGYFHNGCDNELTERCKRMSKAVWCKEAKILHDHPVRPDFKGEIDKVHKLVQNQERWKHDRELLKKRAKEIGFSFKENFVEPKLSAIMLMRNNFEMTKNAIESLLKNTKSLGELIVVDNGSTEDFKSYISELKHRGINIIYKHNKERGIPASWNIGAALATFPYLAFLDNDILFSPDWETSEIKFLDKNVWCVSPYSTRGELPKDFPKGSTKHKNRQNGEFGLDFLGCCFIMAKETWDKIKPIDERLKLWCGDNFIVDSIQYDFGKKVKEVAESYIHHWGSRTLVNEKVDDILAKDMATYNNIIKEKGWIK